MNETPVASVATKAISLIREGKSAKLTGMVPKGQSPAVYIDLIKNMVMGVDKQGNQRPDNDLLLFLYTCKRTGLDPLTRQIYAVYRWDSRVGAEKMVIQTGIDGMRLAAQRSGFYAGQDDAVFSPVNESGEEVEAHPTKASVTVYKMIGSVRVSFTASARWSEYVQTGKDNRPSAMWARMPYLMLAKCAEALALRKAFPNELSGIYADEEMPKENQLVDLPKPEKLPTPEKTEPVAKVDTTKTKSVAEAREAIVDEANHYHGQDGKN